MKFDRDIEDITTELSGIIVSIKNIAFELAEPEGEGWGRQSLSIQLHSVGEHLERINNDLGELEKAEIHIAKSDDPVESALKTTARTLEFVLGTLATYNSHERR